MEKWVKMLPKKKTSSGKSTSHIRRSPQTAQVTPSTVSARLAPLHSRTPTDRIPDAFAMLDAVNAASLGRSQPAASLFVILPHRRNLTRRCGIEASAHDNKRSLIQPRVVRRHRVGYENRQLIVVA